MAATEKQPRIYTLGTPLLGLVLFACKGAAPEHGTAQSDTATAPTTGIPSEYQTSDQASDCTGIDDKTNCLAGYLATQEFSISEIDASHGRSPLVGGAEVTFLDAADFADRFAASVIVPRLKAQFNLPLVGSQEWQISFEPQIGRDTFGRGFMLDMQGPHALALSIQDAGRFQLAAMRDGQYAARLFKEFRLRYVQPTTGELHTDCVVIDWYRPDINFGPSSRHLELGPIKQYSFYMRRGSECGSDAVVASTATPSDVAPLPAVTVSGGGGGSAINRTTVADAAVTRFGAVIGRYCGEQLIAYVPSEIATVNPWLVKRDGRDLIAQQLDANSQTLSAVGTPTRITGQNYICANTAYSQLLVTAAAGRGRLTNNLMDNLMAALMVTWNCTGDGVDRYWQSLVGPNQPLSGTNSFIGNTIDYEHCRYHDQLNQFACGSRLYNSDLSLGEGTFKTTEVESPYTGVTELNPDTLAAYDGRWLWQINQATGVPSNVGATRSLGEALFMSRPILLKVGQHLIAAGRVFNTLLIEQIDLVPTVRARGTIQIPLPMGEGDIYPVVSTLGTRLLTLITNTDGCREMRLSDVLPES
jgi:hypothetical protein